VWETKLPAGLATELAERLCISQPSRSNAACGCENHTPESTRTSFRSLSGKRWERASQLQPIVPIATRKES
jgi:hypothetical protein